MQVFHPSRNVVAIWLYCVAIAAWAGSSYADFLNALATRESSFTPNAMNAGGYVGLFQMGEAALVDAGYFHPTGGSVSGNSWIGTFSGLAGVNSVSSFRSNPDAQVQAITAYETAQWNVIQNLGLTQYVGQTINGTVITQSGLIAGAHLVGYGGLQQYLQSGGTYNVTDGNGTPISQYISMFGGYTIGGPTPTYAAVLAGSGTAGQNSTVASSGGTTLYQSLPAAPPSSNVPPDQAFSNTTGFQYGAVSNLIKELIASILFAWLAWTTMSTWRVYREGKLAFMQLKTDVIRAFIILMVSIMLIS